MKILDRYLIRQFLSTALFALFAFAGLFVVIDLMENMDDFIDNNVATDLIIEYYIVFLPDILRLMTPVAVLLSSLFTAGKMSTQNEITAIKSSGISLYRFMLPFIAVSFLISVFSIYFGGYLVPQANKRKVFIEQKYMNKGIEQSSNNIFFQDSKTRIVSISFYDASTKNAYRVSLQEFRPNDITKMDLRVDAPRMQYIDSLKSWVIFDGIQRQFSDIKENMHKFSEMPYPKLNFKPEDIETKQRKPAEMNLEELKNFAEAQLLSGNAPTRELIEYHSRFAFAFASLVVVFLGLPISANKRKGGLALHFGINLLLTFIYLGFMKISQAFGTNGALDPFTTAWLANFIFLAASAINLLRMND